MSTKEPSILKNAHTLGASAKPNRGFLLAPLVTLATGCLGTAGPSVLPKTPALVRAQIIIHGDFPIPNEHRLFEDLTTLRGEISEKLALPPEGEPVHIYLFESAPRFRSYMALHHPNLPSRRAFFIETDTRLSVYAHWNDRVAEDLRHEVTHGYLHALVPNLPLWLDEGLAEYFEVPRGHAGVNPPHVELLLERFTQGELPSLARLEQSLATEHFTQVDYAEAWGWIHFLLESTDENREILTGYLDSLRRQGTSDPLVRRIQRSIPQSETALVDHVRRIAQKLEADRLLSTPDTSTQHVSLSHDRAGAIPE